MNCDLIKIINALFQYQCDKTITFGYLEHWKLVPNTNTFVGLWATRPTSWKIPQVCSPIGQLVSERTFNHVMMMTFLNEVKIYHQPSFFSLMRWYWYRRKEGSLFKVDCYIWENDKSMWTWIGAMYLEALMVPMVTWLSSNWAMMSSAPAIINVSLPWWGERWKSVFCHKLIICKSNKKILLFFDWGRVKWMVVYLLALTRGM